MSRASFTSVVLAVARRTLHNFVTNPAILLPSLLFPLFFFTAFAGGLSAVDRVPGFDFPSGYTAFQFVFVLLQSAAFGGVFTGFSVAADYENGFARRLMLAAPHRTAIVAGYALAALARALLVGLMLFAIALATGMQVDGGGVDLFGLVGLAVLVNVAAGMWAIGIALRFRSIQAGPFMQIPTFLVLFMAPVYVPLDLLRGWIQAVASVNPATALVEAGRGFISGEPTGVALAFAVAAGMVLLLGLWGLRSLRRAETAGA
jgi:ABC-2 type transport system permease protein